jgi:hypothetical protein
MRNDYIYASRPLGSGRQIHRFDPQRVNIISNHIPSTASASPHDHVFETLDTQ